MNYKAIIISIIQFLISFFIVDNEIFNDTSNLNTYLIYKAIFFIILIVIWHWIFKMIESYRKNEFVRKQIHFTCIYLTVMLAILIIVWPGIWRWDEFFVLNKALDFQLNYWQHFLTSLFYIFSLMIYPAPVSIILMQIIIMSFIVGYILSTCHIMFNKSKVVYLLFIPFLIPPVIDNNFYPIRTSLYAYIELFFVFWIINKKLSKKDISLSDIFFSSIIIALLVNWRSECIYYIILAPIIILVAFKDQLKIKNKICYLVLILIFSLSIMQIQSTGTKKESGKKYMLTSLINPLSMMVQHDLDEDLLNDIDKVLSVEVLKNNPSPYGINAYYVSGLIREDATKEDYNNLIKSYIKLITKNIDLFLKYRIETLKATSGLYPEIRINIFDSSSIFDLNENGEYLKVPYKNFNKLPLTNPIFKDLRKNTIRWLESRDINNIQKATKTYGIFYNVIIIFFILLLLLAFMVILKSKIFILYILGLLMKFGLIFITSPSKIFMYYFPIYLSAVFLLPFTIIVIFIKKRENNLCIN
jgi:hypothetical protein